MNNYVPPSGFVDMDIPLLPRTRDPDGVSALVGAILREIEYLDGRGQPLDPSDVIQALTIAAAVHEIRERTALTLCGRSMRLERIELANAPSIRASA